MILKRKILLDGLKSEKFDLLVVGGGITGAGIALDAASRGLLVGLVEKGDFASGTSSKSTKLIHGGLRYLKQFQWRVVHEVGQERAIVHQLAPHLVLPEKMLLPVYKGGSVGKNAIAIGLSIYDFLAGVKGADRRKILAHSTTVDLEPNLNPNDLLGAGLYAEYRTDDARLTIEVVKSAISHGAVCLNYLEVKDFLAENGRLVGANCQDHLSGEMIQVSAKTIINATGPWVDGLRDKDKSLSGKRLFLSKGIHVVVPRDRLPLQHSIYFDASDGRMLFAIPRQRATYLGTTDTAFKGDPDKVFAETEEITYLLDAANRLFPKAGLTLADVESTWAGLRPLVFEEGKSVGAMSRKDEIIISSSGLISVAGGKLTGYRKMAEKLVDVVLKKQGQTPIICVTKHLALAQEPFENTKEVAEFTAKLEAALTDLGLPSSLGAYLIENYGRDADTILKKLGNSANDESLVLAELEHCLEKELVQKPADFFERRTGMLLFNIQRVRLHLEAVLKYCSAHFGWTADQIVAERATMKELLKMANPIFAG